MKLHLLLIITVLLTINLVAEEPKESNNSKWIYTLEEYQKLGSEKIDFNELAYTQKQYKMFDEKFEDINATEKKPIVLTNENDDVLEVLKDENFLERFPDEKVDFVVYQKNKIMPIAFSKCGSCIGGMKYFMVLEKDILRVKLLEEVVYSLAKPIVCEEDR